MLEEITYYPFSPHCNMRLKNRTEATEIIDTIASLYGGTVIELDYETPFQLLIAVILSAQTTDKQVNKITPPLFAKVKEPKDMLMLELDEIMEHVKFINYYRNKSRFIYGCAKKLVEEFDSTIPNDLKTLMTFPGVGVKTAKVVLSVLYDAPHVGVDTHIHRVCNRIGMVKTRFPEETDKAIVRRLTLAQRVGMHHPFVLFGRYHCTARAPKCSTCKLQHLCNYYQEKLKKEAK
jgi:endonuclease III